MRDGWSVTTLGQAATWRSGGTPRKSNAAYWNGDIPWISGKSLQSERIHHSDRNVTELGMMEGSQTAPAGSTLILVRGMSLLQEVRVGHCLRDVAFNQDVKALVPKDDVDPWFLTYALLARRSELLAMVHTASHGTGVLATDALQALRIPIPPLAEQRRIAAVLGGLDDLIGINQRLTAQLNDAASVTAVRALRLAPSRISIGDVAAHLPGKYLSKDQYVPAGPFVVYGSNSIMGNYSEALYDGPLTVLARIGSNCGALRLSPGGAWINNNASAIKANSGQPAFWIHAALEQIDMDTHRGGSGQPFIRIESLMKESIPWGDQALLESTNKLLGELANATATLSEEIRALATTRDELLPLLMSGAVAPGEVTVAS